MSGLRIMWHRIRRHHVKDLGHPCGQHRVWCYDCYEDLVPWESDISAEIRAL